MMTDSRSLAALLTDSDSDRIYLQFLRLMETEAVGRANALRSARLCRRLDLRANGDRLLRELARRAREAGLLICADDAGYFIPATRDEAQETIGRLRSQGQKMLESSRIIERLAERKFGPEQYPLL